MSRVTIPDVVSGVINPLGESLQTVRGPGSLIRTLYLDGQFRAPVTGELRHQILALLRRGERAIVLDLSGVSGIDAAGVGQLVRAYNVTNAVNGRLRIVHVPRRVREVLERAGLFSLLSTEKRAA
jgi:anti-anti-sigma factor